MNVLIIIAALAAAALSAVAMPFVLCAISSVLRAAAMVLVDAAEVLGIAVYGTMALFKKILAG